MAGGSPGSRSSDASTRAARRRLVVSPSLSQSDNSPNDCDTTRSTVSESVCISTHHGKKKVIQCTQDTPVEVTEMKNANKKGPTPHPDHSTAPTSCSKRRLENDFGDRADGPKHKAMPVEVLMYMTDPCVAV